MTEPHRFVRPPVVVAIAGGLKNQLTEPHRFVRPPVVVVIFAGRLMAQLTEPQRLKRRTPVVVVVVIFAEDRDSRATNEFRLLYFVA